MWFILVFSFCCPTFSFKSRKSAILSISAFVYIRKYYFGNDIKVIQDYAWFGNEGYGGDTYEVGKKKANAWGLLDMHGNVCEWVQDWYDPNYYQHSLEVNPQGVENGQYKVYRGGSWVAKATL